MRGDLTCEFVNGTDESWNGDYYTVFLELRRELPGRLAHHFLLGAHARREEEAIELLLEHAAREYPEYEQLELGS